MSGTLRGEPHVGAKIATPWGVETITSIDNERDMLRTNRHRVVPWEDVRAPEAPESGEVTDIEAWLSGPELILVRQETKQCSCVCTHCNYLVTIRGAEKVVMHMKQNQACTCGSKRECCGYPLGS